MISSSTTADVQLDFNDKTLFGNDAAEDEKADILASYFVTQPSFDDFLNTSELIQVVHAKKGMGKSALLSKFAYELRNSPRKPLVIQLVPSSLTALLEPPSTTKSAILENYWKQVICRAINFEIAKTIGFAWKDDQITLVENAEIANFRGRNIFGSLIGRLLGKTNLLGSIEISPKTVGISNNEQLLKRIKEEESDPREVWFLLDDIDSKFQNSPEQQAYVSSFFSACRALVNEISGLSIRATVRTDVWTNLREAEDLDKFEQYLTPIYWTTNQQKDILVKRIYSFVMRKYPNSYVAKNWTEDRHSDDYINLAFNRRIKWGSSSVPAINVLRILAAGRPRWMAQLCRLAGKKAHDSHKQRIGLFEINEVMVDFGRRRLSDLYKEHNHQFSDLQKLIESFSGGQRRYSTDELVQKILKGYVTIVGASKIPTIDGAPYQDTWQIAHFLYKCGFIAGHNTSDKSLEMPEFITYEMRPDLLSVATNLDDGLVWEIQPSYRKALRIK